MAGERLTQTARDAMHALLRMMVVVVTGLPACTDGTRATAADEQRLLELQEGVLQAHRDNDVQALLDTQADDFIVLNPGEISSPTKHELEQMLGPYLASTQFEYYRDAIPPIVKVSRDRSLGWVMAQVEVRGTQETPEGTREPLAFVVAWIELYERREQGWVAIGNASSFKPD